MVASHSKQAAAVLHVQANFGNITRHMLAPEIQVGWPRPRAMHIRWLDHQQKTISTINPSAPAHSGGKKGKNKSICDQQGEESDLEDEKMLNDKWLKSETALNVAKLELIQLKKKNLELETQAKVELMQLDKKELVLHITKLEQDTADTSNC